MNTQEKVSDVIIPKTDIMVDIAIKCPDCNKMFPVRINFQGLSNRVEYIRCRNCFLPMSITFSNNEFILSSMYNKEFNFDLVLCSEHKRKAIINLNCVSYCDLCIKQHNLQFTLLERIVLLCDSEGLYSTPTKMRLVEETDSFIFYDEAWNNFTYKVKFGNSFFCLDIYYFGVFVSEARINY